jgi:hypothetical protein
MESETVSPREMLAGCTSMAFWTGKALSDFKISDSGGG